MLKLAEGASVRDVIQLYAFVLEKTRQHLIFYNFYECAMPLKMPDFSDYRKKIFMHGPVAQCQLSQGESWLSCNHLVIKENGQSYIETFGYVLKIFDSLFYEILYAENYVLKIISHVAEGSEVEELRYLLGALSVNHTLTFSELPKGDGKSLATFEFSSWGPDGLPYIFCHGTWNKQIGFTIDVTMLELVQLVAKKSEKLPLPQAPLLYVIVPLTEQQKMLALTLAHMLQKHAYAIDVYLQQVDFDEHLRQARSVGAGYVLAIGPDEQAAGTVLINDLAKHTSTAVRHDKVLTFLGGAH
ncbi:MAG: His/Gly/Thr/Pro-type tRNA ligase C-terminal domain-containing protein [Candidatus Babeliales bacterium]|jgi:hypothetical protein